MDTIPRRSPPSPSTVSSVTRRVTALTVMGEDGERRGPVSMETLAHFADRDKSDTGVEA